MSPDNDTEIDPEKSGDVVSIKQGPSVCKKTNHAELNSFIINTLNL